MTTVAESSRTAVSGAKAGPAVSWKEEEEHVVPPNRIGIVFFGLMCSAFLAALDQVSAIIFRDNLSLTNMPPDHHSHCFAHNRGGAWRRKELQLGRKVGVYCVGRW